MSLTVLLIGAVHAVPVVIAAFTGSWLVTILAAIGTTFFAFATGGSQWVVFDLVGIGLGLYLASNVISDQKQRKASSAAPSTGTIDVKVREFVGDKKKDDDTWGGIATGIGMLAVIAYNAVTKTSEPPPKTYEPVPPPKVLRVEPTVREVPNPTRTYQYAQPTNGPQPSHSQLSHSRDIRDCLSLATNEAIARCSERRK